VKLNIRNPFAKSETAPAVPVQPKGLTPQEVWEAPATFNRATRRWARLWGSVWRWDPRALGIPADLPARYVRRHFVPAQFLNPKTRRQRRHRARVIRSLQQKGQYPR
jgi:hypothetical protein